MCAVVPSEKPPGTEAGADQESPRADAGLGPSEGTGEGGREEALTTLRSQGGSARPLGAPSYRGPGSPRAGVLGAHHLPGAAVRRVASAASSDGFQSPAAAASVSGDPGRGGSEQHSLLSPHPSEVPVSLRVSVTTLTLASQCSVRMSPHCHSPSLTCCGHTSLPAAPQTYQACPLPQGLNVGCALCSRVSFLWRSLGPLPHSPALCSDGPLAARRFLTSLLKLQPPGPLHGPTSLSGQRGTATPRRHRAV